jgi:hypothetical protein
MSRARNALAVLVPVAALGIGVVGARALQGSDGTSTAAPAEPADGQAVPQLVDGADAPVTVDALTPASLDELLPVLQPVAVGNDPAIVDQLINAPSQQSELPSDSLDNEASGWSSALQHGGGYEAPPGLLDPTDLDPALIETATSPSTPSADDSDDGTVPVDAVPIDDSLPADTPPGTAPPGDSPATPAVPFFFDTSGLRFPFPFGFYDPCAGVEPDPGRLPPPRCPEGSGGTVIGGPGLPALEVNLSYGHYNRGRDGTNNQLCADQRRPTQDGLDHLMFGSNAPLASATLQWRPRGSSEPWQSFEVTPATPAEQAAEWERRRANEGLEPWINDRIFNCVSITRDQQQPFELRSFGADIFGRSFATDPFTLYDITPGGRPPTISRVATTTNTLSVTAYTTRGGSVSFAFVPIADPDSLTDPSYVDPIVNANCQGYVQVVGEVVGVGGPRPEGIWDPIYSNGQLLTVDLPFGGGGIVCATIFDTANTLRPLANDVIIARGAAMVKPEITLVGLRVNDGVTLDRSLSVAARYELDAVPDDGCSNGFQLDGTLAAPGAVVDEPLWRCGTTPVPLDERGRVKVPITVTRWQSGSYANRQFRTVGIPVELPICIPGCGLRPDAYYEIPIPTGETGLRGCVFDCSSEPPNHGAAIIKVSYPIVGSRFDSSTWTAAATDRGADPITGAPRIAAVDFSRWSSDGLTDFATTVTFISDRPVTVTGVGTTSWLFGEPSLCGAPTETPLSPIGPATEFTVDVSVACPTDLRTMFLTVTDAADVSHRVEAANLRSPELRANRVTATIQLGGDSRGYDQAYLYEFSAGMGGSPFALARTGGYVFAPPPVSGCVSTNSRITTRSPVDITPFSDRIFIGVRFNFTTVCDGRGSSRNAISVVELSGEFTYDQIEAGVPLVITTPADARLPITMTVDVGQWALYLADGSRL